MLLLALFLRFRRAYAYALNLSYPSSFRVVLVGTYTHARPAAASLLISTRPVPILKQRGGGTLVPFLTPHTNITLFTFREGGREGPAQNAGNHYYTYQNILLVFFCCNCYNCNIPIPGSSDRHACNNGLKSERERGNINASDRLLAFSVPSTVMNSLTVVSDPKTSRETDSDD